MAERKRVDVDEKLLQQMMAGEVPAFLRGNNQNPQSINPEQEPVVEKQDIDPEMYAPNQEPEKEITKVQKRKRNHQFDFTSTFLKPGEVGAKKQIYVSESVYNKMMGYFYVIGERKINIVNYIDNIIINHMEEYKEEINRLYGNKMRKPLD